MNKSPEIIVVAVVLAIFALVAGGLAYFFPDVSDITGVASLQASGSSVKKITAEDFESSLAAWNSPALWQEPDSHNRLFDSDKWLFYPSAFFAAQQLPSADDIKKMDSSSRTPSGVLIGWYQKYKIDFTDSNVDNEDPDGDGFSNIVEFKNEPVGKRIAAADCDGTQSCDPLDPKSHPSYLSRLRLQSYDKIPFHILFNGYQKLNGVDVFQIYLKDVDSDQQPPLKKTGDPLGVEGYIIGAFNQKFASVKNDATGLTEQVDQSTLELDKPDIDFHITVPFRQEIDSPESTADFVMLMPSERDKVMKVPRGKTFTVPFISDTSFLVLAADDDGARIRDTTTKQEYHILKLDPSEWNEVPQSPPDSQEKTP
jgi:hypothetical protein